MVIELQDIRSKAKRLNSHNKEKEIFLINDIIIVGDSENINTRQT